MVSMKPPEEKLATVLLVGSMAATARPLAVDELPTVLPGPLLAEAVTGSTLALTAQASMACWLTSVGLGLLP